MKVKLTTMRVANVKGETVVQEVGQVIDVETSEARSLLENGYAEPYARTKAKQAETR